MTRVPRSPLVAAAALLVAAPAFAQNPPLNNQWVEYDNITATNLAVSPGSVSSTTTETDLAWGDLDKDGWIDLVVVRKQAYTSAGKRQNMLFMNENGVLTDRTVQYATDSDVGGDLGFRTSTNDRDVIIADVDGDGWDDLVTATTLSDGDPKHIGHPRIYMNLGNDGGGNWQGFRYEDGRFPQLKHYGTGANQNPRFCSVVAGDVTGDGAVDLYFGDYDSSGAGGVNQGANEDLNDRLLINDGNGFFTDESQARITTAALKSAFGMAVAMEDFNQDGRLDIIRDSALMAPQNVGIHYNNLNGTVTEGNFNNFHVVHSFAPYHVNTGDLNNDGRMDIVVSDDGDDKYRYNLSNDAAGRAVWGTAKEYGAAGECASNGCIDDGFGSNNLIIDLDGDGWNDAIHADIDVDIPSGTRRMHIYHNPGGAVGSQITLHEEQQLTANNSGWKGVVGMTSGDQQATHDVGVFDLDNDGDNDMIISRMGGTYVWENLTLDGICQADLGFGGPGSSTLEICGAGLSGGDTSTFLLENAPASATSFVTVSLAGGANVGVKGGTLVSGTNLLPGMPLVFATNGSGELTFPIPGGFGTFDVVVQAITVDGGQPLGFGFSNAVLASFTP